MTIRSNLHSFFHLLLLLVFFLLLRIFVFEVTKVNGNSMYSSYYDKEFIAIEKMSYIFQAPQRGDVIVFRPDIDDPSKHFLKRIIGLPKETIKITQGNIYVKKHLSDSFVKIHEPYLNEINQGFTFVGNDSFGTHEYILEPDEYFVVGDNRGHSTDSRECFGDCNQYKPYIKKDDIIGKVFFDFGYFSLKKFRFYQPELGITSSPRFFDGPTSYEYTELTQ